MVSENVAVGVSVSVAVSVKVAVAVGVKVAVAVGVAVAVAVAVAVGLGAGVGVNRPGRAISTGKLSALEPGIVLIRVGAMSPPRSMPPNSMMSVNISSVLAVLLTTYRASVSALKATPSGRLSLVAPP